MIKSFSLLFSTQPHCLLVILLVLFQLWPFTFFIYMIVILQILRMVMWRFLTLLTISYSLHYSSSHLQVFNFRTHLLEMSLLDSSFSISLEGQSNLLNTAFQSHSFHDKSSLLPRFLSYRELLTFLYHNKGVDLEAVRNLIKTQNNEALVELIAFILDRPISPDEQFHLFSQQSQRHDGENVLIVESTSTLVKFGEDNNNIALTDLHQNALIPGHRCQERDVVDFLGLAHGCRQQCGETFILMTLFNSAFDTIDTLLQWDIMRIIRSRNWMDELYLGSTFRETVYNSPFRIHLAWIKRLLQLNAISLDFAKFNCYEKLLSLTFGPAVNQKYQDHINLWLGTQYDRNFQTLHSVFGVHQLLGNTQGWPTSYESYVIYIHGIIEQIKSALINSPNIVTFNYIFNNEIPFIPLFDNANQGYVLRDRDHGDADQYDDRIFEQFEISQSPSPQEAPQIACLNTSQISFGNIDEKTPLQTVLDATPKWSHKCSTAMSPLIREFVMHLTRNCLFSTFGNTSTIQQLQTDIAQLQGLPDDTKKNPTSIITHATLFPTRVTLDDLQLVLEFQSRLFDLSRQATLVYFSIFGCDYITPCDLQTNYTIARLYNDTGMMSLFTQISGINDDNMWTYSNTIRTLYQNQPFSYTLDVFYYPFAKTEMNQAPLTQVLVQPHDPSIYADKNGNNLYEPGQLNKKPTVLINGKKKTFISLGERVDLVMTRTWTTNQLCSLIFFFACENNLDRIIALWDHTKDYFHKEPIKFDQIDATTPLDDIGGLDPSSIKFPHNVSWFTEQIDTTTLPLINIFNRTAFYLALSQQFTRITTFQFLLSAQHGRVITSMCDKTSWCPNYINSWHLIYHTNPFSAESYGTSIEYYNDSGVARTEKNNKSHLIALPKVHDHDDVIIINQQPQPVQPLTHPEIDTEQGLDVDDDGKKKKKMHLTQLEFTQYTTFSQDQINTIRRGELSSFPLSPVASSLLPFAMRLLIRHTKQNKHLFRPSLLLSQSILDEMAQTEADNAAAAAAKKTPAKTKSKTITTSAAVINPSPSPGAPKKILLPRISKAKFDNSIFWRMFGGMMQFGLLNAHHDPGSYTGFIDVVCEAITNDMLSLDPLWALSGDQYESSLETLDSSFSFFSFLTIILLNVNQNQFLLTAPDIFPIIEQKTLYLIKTVLLHNPARTHSLIRNGFTCFHDFAAGIIQLSTPKNKSFSVLLKSQIPTREQIVAQFAESFSVVLFELLTTLTTFSPQIFDWFFEMYRDDIIAFFLGGDDRDVDPSLIPFVQSPTHLLHSPNSPPKNKDEYAYHFNPHEFYFKQLPQFANFLVEPTSSSTEPIHFLLSDFPYLPSFSSLQDDFTMKPHTAHIDPQLLSTLPKDPALSKVAKAVIHNLQGFVFPDYLPPHFDHTNFHHFDAFLPPPFQHNPTKSNILFPHQQFQYLRTPTHIHNDKKSSDITSSAQVPIYSLPSFFAAINECMPYSLSIQFASCFFVSRYHSNEEFQTIQGDHLLNRPSFDLATSCNFFPLLHCSQSIEVYPAIPQRFEPLRPGRQFETYQDYFQDSLPNKTFTNAPPLPPMIPWSTYPIVFNTSLSRQSILQWVGSDGGLIPQIGDQIDVIPWSIPVIRYPSILSVDPFSRSTQSSISSLYSTSLSCIGYEARALSRLPGPLPSIQPLMTAPTSAPSRINPFSVFHDKSFQTGLSSPNIDLQVQQGCSLMPFVADLENHDPVVSSICVSFSPYARRVVKYINNLVELNNNTHPVYQNRYLHLFNTFLKLQKAVGIYIIWDFWAEHCPVLKDFFKQARIATPNATVGELYTQILTKCLNIEHDQLNYQLMLTVFLCDRTIRPAPRHRSAILSHLFPIASPLTQVAPQLVPNSSMLSSFVYLTTPSQAGSGSSPNNDFNWIIDLSYISELSREFMNCCGIFNPNEINKIYTKYTSYMTSTTLTSRYRDGKQFASTNYIKCDANNDDYIVEIHEESVTFQFAQLRHEYFNFLFHDFNPSTISDKSGFGPLPAPFSTTLYKDDPTHIVNRYNRFVESQLCSPSRINTRFERNQTTLDGYNPFYGTRIVFDFDQFLQSPSLGALSLVPNISTTADHTTATAVITEKFPAPERPGLTSYSVDLLTQGPTSFTPTFNDRYIMDPTTHNPSPITTPIYNHLPDNILNFPEQFYQSLLHHANFLCAGRGPSITPQPTFLIQNEYIDSNLFQSLIEYLNTFSSLFDQGLISNSSFQHHFITKSKKVELLIGTTSTTLTDLNSLSKARITSFGKCPGLYTKFLRFLKQNPELGKTYSNFISELQTRQQCVVEMNNYPFPSSPPQVMLPALTSTRYLMLILQHFTSQPVSPFLIYPISESLMRTQSLTLNLLDVLLWKTNGDFFHSTISRSFYTLGNDFSSDHFKTNVQPYKLEPIDYHYFLPHIYVFSFSRLQLGARPFHLSLPSLAMKYNITSELVAAHSVNTHMELTKLRPDSWKADPIQPRGRLSAADFYQPGEDLNDFNLLPQKQSFLYTLANNVNPFQSHSTLVKVLGTTASVALIAGIALLWSKRGSKMISRSTTFTNKSAYDDDDLSLLDTTE